MVAAREVTLRAGRRVLVEGVSIELRAGEVPAQVGPNGAGKPSALRALTGERSPDAGEVALAAWRPVELARRRAVVSQSTALTFPMTAAEVAALRAPGEVPAPARIEAVYGLGFRAVPGGGVLPCFEAAG